jgi:SOS-response transcriptional repressor LexA
LASIHVAHTWPDIGARVYQAVVVGDAVIAITAGEMRMLRAIRDWQSAQHYPPSYAELAERLGYRSKNSVHVLVMSLDDKGLIVHEQHRARKVGLTERGKQVSA